MVSDAALGMDRASCGDARLAPGATTGCTGTHTLTQTEIDAGAVTNTASAAAKTPVAQTPTVSATASATTPITATSSMTLDKAGPAPVEDARAEQTIAYTFTVTNTGATTITDLTIDDPLLASAPSCTPTTLLPGDVASCTGTLTLTQAQVDAGSVTNLATARASTTRAGERVSVPPVTDTVTTTLRSTSGVSVTAEAGTLVDTGAAGATAGDQMPVTITVTNTGTVTLTNVRLDDPKLGLTGFVCTAGPLAPQASATCSVPAYVLTQTDVDAGEVSFARERDGLGTER